MEVAKAGEAMVHGHHHDIAEFGELRAVVDARSPDVERETILSHSADVLIPLDHHAVVAVQTGQSLGTDWAMADRRLLAETPHCP